MAQCMFVLATENGSVLVLRGSNQSRVWDLWTDDGTDKS